MREVPVRALKRAVLVKAKPSCVVERIPREPGVASRTCRCACVRESDDGARKREEEDSAVRT
jgi:hypothetical protein